MGTARDGDSLDACCSSGEVRITDRRIRDVANEKVGVGSVW